MSESTTDNQTTAVSTEETSGESKNAESSEISSEMKDLIGPDGTNSKLMTCPYCPSKILLAGKGKYHQEDFYLHVPYKKNEPGAVEGETLKDHWMIDDQFKFENVGVTRQVPAGSTTTREFKYLTCAECERGPLGISFLDNPKVFYVSHARVKYP